MKKVLLLPVILLLLSLQSCEFAEDNPYYITYTGIDYLVIRYYWDSGTGGTDLDTRTAIVDPARNIDVGWARGATDGGFLEWGGDNTGVGYESVLISLRELATRYTGHRKFDIRMRAFWFSTRISGDINIEFTGYDGGRMVKDGYNWINQGGTQLGQATVIRNIVTQVGSNVDGDEAGIARYYVKDEVLEILDP
ncbi:MAG TPA: hypothetical protein ENN21_02955 [Spirochaetes bacterium]|nr:hypothetical protein [Spirochaetota bacterium]